MAQSPSAIRTQGLRFRYDEASPELFRELSWEIPAGSRTLLVGGNGVGKTTLLSLVAGRHLLPRGMIEVFGRSPFDPGFSDALLVDGDFPVDVDLSVAELLAHPTPGVDSAKQRELLELLAVDPRWRMHRVSEGQRRRVQLLLVLRKRTRLLLLDEVTSHLDVVARGDLLQWLFSRSDREGLTIVFTTHILDGLWDDRSRWPTHLAFLGAASSSALRRVDDIADLRAGSLLTYCDARIREDHAGGRP